MTMDDFEWTVVSEGQLFDAMVGHKPVGINKYFQMAFIQDKLTENLNKEIQSSKIWTHLETMYNLEALDESEALPFPNEEREFYLPESEFGALKLKKEEKVEEKKPQKGRETPKLTKEILKKDEVKTPIRTTVKENPRRDSKDKEVKTPVAKKEVKKEPEKPKAAKGRPPAAAAKEEKNSKGKREREESPRPPKRPTRGSLKPDDSSNGGKASPLTITPTPKRRRI